MSVSFTKGPSTSIITQHTKRYCVFRNAYFGNTAIAFDKAVLGPTNTGKTHLAIERMLAHASGIIGFPLRLLARENYDRMVVRKGARYVALITGEEKIIPPDARWSLILEAKNDAGDDRCIPGPHEIEQHLQFGSPIPAAAAGLLRADNVAAGSLRRGPLHAQVLVDGGNAGVAIERHETGSDSVSLESRPAFRCVSSGSNQPK